MSFLCGRMKAPRPTGGFLTWFDEGDPMLLFETLNEVRRGGGSMEPTPDGLDSSTDVSVKLSKRLGVDEHERPLVATLPK